MKYKILLAGKNQSTIDDFFYAMSSSFECMTTSVRNLDMITHFKYFAPDAFVYCMSVETKESIMSLVKALEEAGRKKLKLILVGEHEDCKEFSRWKPDMISLMLEKPINANTISEKIVKMLEEESEQEKEEEKPIAQLEKQQNSFGDKQILVIDDDHMMLKLIKEKLRSEYSVATAVSGKIGLDFLARKKVDLILLDYEMPGDSGADVLEKIRANPQIADIPVVFLTGINDKEKIQKVLALKPNGYLLKPIEHEKLMTTIKKIIG